MRARLMLAALVLVTLAWTKSIEAGPSLHSLCPTDEEEAMEACFEDPEKYLREANYGCLPFEEDCLASVDYSATTEEDSDDQDEQGFEGDDDEDGDFSDDDQDDAGNADEDGSFDEESFAGEVDVIEADDGDDGDDGYNPELPHPMLGAEAYQILHDRATVDVLSKALKQIITPKSVVLVVDSGLGLLPMLAAHLGAKNVTAVQSNLNLHLVAAQVLEDNGFLPLDGNVHLLYKDYHDVGIRDIGGIKANVVLTELLDSQLTGDDVLRVLGGLRERGLIERDATVVPGQASIFAKLVFSSLGLGIKQQIAGFSFEAARVARHKDDWIFASEVANLTESVKILQVDFARSELPNLFASVDLQCTTDGTVNAVQVTWEASLDAEGKLSIGSRVGGHWKPVSYALLTDVECKQNEWITLVAARDQRSHVFVATPRGKTPAFSAMHFTGGCKVPQNVYVSENATHTGELLVSELRFGDTALALVPFGSEVFTLDSTGIVRVNAQAIRDPYAAYVANCE